MQFNHAWKVNCIGLYTIVRREVTRFVRIWSQTLLPSVISMALYFVIFGHWIGERIGKIGNISYIEYITPGLIMMSMITNSYGNVVASFFTSKFQRNIEELLVSPLSNSIILWGYVLGGILRGIMVGTLVTLVSLWFTPLTIHHYGMIFTVGLLTVVLFSLIGFINGMLAKKFDDINIIPTFVLTPLTYLGGVFYSIQLLQDYWRMISLANPVFYMINAFRFGMHGVSDVDPYIALWVIVGFILLLYGLAVWMLKKGIGIKT